MIKVMKRTIYKSLLKWKSAARRKPLLLQGARQVGKTYLLKAFGKNEFRNVHYLNFERDPILAKIFAFDLDPKRILNDLSLYLKTRISIKKDLLIMDEIQACPEALTSLKYFCEDLPSAYVVCAGSLLGVYLGSHSYPVGMVDHLYLHPMSFGEFLRATGEEQASDLLEGLHLQSSISDYAHAHLWQMLKRYFIVGGLPEVVSLYIMHQAEPLIAYEKVRQKQRDLIEDYSGDIAKHSGKANSMHIRRIWQSVPEQLSATQDGSANKYKFSDAVKGVDRYKKLANAIDWLENAGLVLKVHIVSESKTPLKAQSKENTFKLLLFDVGILGAMCDLEPVTLLQQDYGSYKGYFAENYIAQALVYKDHQSLYCWMGKTAEVEFVRQIRGSLIPYEVKSGWVTQSKSLKVYNEKYQPTYRVILGAKNLNVDIEHAIHHYPLYLASYLPLNSENL